AYERRPAGHPRRRWRSLAPPRSLARSRDLASTEACAEADRPDRSHLLRDDRARLGLRGRAFRARAGSRPLIHARHLRRCATDDRALAVERWAPADELWPVAAPGAVLRRRRSRR